MHANSGTESCSRLLAGNVGEGQLLEALTTENSWLEFRVSARPWSAALLDLCLAALCSPLHLCTWLTTKLFNRLFLHFQTCHIVGGSQL